MDAPAELRRDFDAGQMGVPVVCGVGSCVSLRGDGADRSGFREGSAYLVYARMVHASERAAPRLRMEFFGRESARTRVGSVARLQNCGSRERKARPKFPRARLP